MITESPAGRSYLPMTESLGAPHADAEGVTDEMIREVVNEFYRRARLDDQIGPVFEAYVGDWDVHLSRMADFWSSALLRTGRYSGHPVEEHRKISELADGHFDRWIALFEDTVLDLCPPREARAFLVRARRMREGISKVLLMLNGGPRFPRA